MRIFKYLSGLLIFALTIQLSISSANSATTPDEQFQVPAPAEEQMRGYYVNELAESTQSTSTE